MEWQPTVCVYVCVWARAPPIWRGAREGEKKWSVKIVRMHFSLVFSIQQNENNTNNYLMRCVHDNCTLEWPYCMICTLEWPYSAVRIRAVAACRTVTLIMRLSFPSRHIMRTWLEVGWPQRSRRPNLSTIGSDGASRCHGHPSVRWMHILCCLSVWL